MSTEGIEGAECLVADMALKEFTVEREGAGENKSGPRALDHRECHRRVCFNERFGGYIGYNLHRMDCSRDLMAVDSLVVARFEMECDSRRALEFSRAKGAFVISITMRKRVFVPNQAKSVSILHGTDGAHLLQGFRCGEIFFAQVAKMTNRGVERVVVEVVCMAT